MKRLLSILLCLTFMFSLSVFAAAQENDKTYTNTGNLLKDFIGHAETKTGYISDENGSMFDSVTGNKSDNWSSSFIAWCALKAGISEESIPHVVTVDELFSSYDGKDKIITDDNHIPQEGELIFIAENGILALCGIVTYCDNQYVTAIIGDDDNTVKKKMYDLSLSKIKGYTMPDYTLRTIIRSGNYITTADFLNFRSEPTTTSEILAKIPKGTIVDITEIKDGWGSIRYDGKDGYISMDYAAEYDTTHIDSPRYAVNWNVIDISKFQGEIDWNKLSAQNIDAVILRLGFRGTVSKVMYYDEKFLEFYNKAIENGFHVGCYFYSGATTVTEAREEADFMIDIIRNNNLTFDMPVYWDVEDDVIRDTGSDNIIAMTEEFFTVMDEGNLYSGVYTSSNWMLDYYTPEIFSGHSLWVADWRGYCGYQGDYSMWQYTDAGKVEGIDGHTDMNYCYINYPLLIEDLGYNTDKDVETPRAKGDINGDGKITAADAREALRAAAGLSKLEGIQNEAADYNNDGKVTAADARLILRKAANID